MRTLLRVGAVFVAIVVIGFLATALFTLQRQNAQADEQAVAVDRAVAAQPSIAQLRSVAAPVLPSGETQILLRTKIVEIDRAKLAKQGIGLFDFIKPSKSSAPLTAQQLQTTQFASLNERETELFTNLIRATGAAKILAEPTIVSVEGRPASFHNGGEFPILAPQDQGTTSIEFRKFGTVNRLHHDDTVEQKT